MARTYRRSQATAAPRALGPIALPWAPTRDGQEHSGTRLPPGRCGDHRQDGKLGWIAMPLERHLNTQLERECVECRPRSVGRDHILQIGLQCQPRGDLKQIGELDGLFGVGHWEALHAWRSCSVTRCGHGRGRSRVHRWRGPRSRLPPSIRFPGSCRSDRLGSHRRPSARIGLTYYEIRNMLYG